jgi:hypothetical protein
MRVTAAPWHGRGGRAAVAWLGAVAALEATRRAAGWPAVQDLASSPAEVARGRVWSLLTSALLVTRDPIVQLVAAALLTVAAMQALGPATFWLAAAAGHVGSALLAYAGIGLLRLIGRADVDSVVHAPDFGISCVVIGVLGALTVAASGRRSPGWRMLAIAAGVALWAVIPPFGLAAVEHALAFALGAVAAVAATRRSRRPDPSFAAVP